MRILVQFFAGPGFDPDTAPGLSFLWLNFEQTHSKKFLTTTFFLASKKGRRSLIRIPLSLLHNMTFLLFSFFMFILACLDLNADPLAHLNLYSLSILIFIFKDKSNILKGSDQ
jgi:hypothetical protein